MASRVSSRGSRGVLVCAVLLLLPLPTSGLPDDPLIRRYNRALKDVAAGESLSVQASLFPTSPIFHGAHAIRGMKATRDIKRGEVVLQLPARTIVTQAAVRRRLRAAGVAGGPGGGLFEDMENALPLLALHILNETTSSVGPSSSSSSRG
eukprot:g1918.t1